MRWGELTEEGGYVPELAKTPTNAVFARMKTAAEGLTDAEAARRIEEVGPNVVVSEKHRGWWWRLLTAARNTLVILLIVLAGISFATGDARAGSVMALMVILGVTLRFVQESRADAAAAKLKAMITVTATVVRGGKAGEIPLKQLAPGDVVMLSAGDMIPADVRVMVAKDLFISQAALTGESLPVEKFEAPETREGVTPLEFSNICFLGTSVESGAATVVVLATGARTYFGGMAGSIVGDPVETSFDKGMKDFTWLMIRFIMVMVPLVFLINGLTRHNWQEAFFFSIAVAVGLTPEMLPMIVSVCLSKGALAMSRKKVIVKQLNAIQNFGAMDVLCTDKTGTLTMDQVILQRHCDVMKRESESVFLDAFLIAHFQTGLKNVLDRAVLNHHDAQVERLAGYRKVDEIPFDFVRRMMSVVVEKPDKDHQLLTKGAPEAVFPRCTFYELDGKVLPLEPARAADLTLHYEELSADGFRVLAVAHKHLGDIRRFVLFIGPVSSIFDYTTFFVMLYLFGCWDPARASLFQTGWFVESLITQTLIIHIIRTNKLPFIHGRASWPVTMTTLLVIAIAMWLPSSPVAAALGFTPLPALYWPILAVTVVCYVLLTQAVKTWLLRKMWI